MRLKISIAAFMAMLALADLSPDAQATTCRPPGTIQEEFNRSDLVFVGRVKDSNLDKRETVFTIDELFKDSSSALTPNGDAVIHETALKDIGQLYIIYASKTYFARAPHTGIYLPNSCTALRRVPDWQKSLLERLAAGATSNTLDMAEEKYAENYFRNIHGYSSRIILRGTVTEIQHVIPGKPKQYPGSYVTFDINKVYKDRDNQLSGCKKVKLSIGGYCRFAFRVGEEYIVHASRRSRIREAVRDGRALPVFGGLCRERFTQSLDEIKMLRKLAKENPTGAKKGN